MGDDFKVGSSEDVFGDLQGMINRFAEVQGPVTAFGGIPVYVSKFVPEGSAYLMAADIANPYAPGKGVVLWTHPEEMPAIRDIGKAGFRVWLRRLGRRITRATNRWIAALSEHRDPDPLRGL